MTAHFYFHTEVANVSERRAFIDIANTLNKYDATNSGDIHLIANIDPQKHPRLRNKKLAQLDALLITPTFVSIIEFKSYVHPIIGKDVNSKWHIKTQGKSIRVNSGHAQNPFQQIKAAKQRWGFFLQEQTSHLVSAKQKATNWNHLQGWLVFHPFLHADSKIPQTPEAPWFSVLSSDTIQTQLVTSYSKLHLTEQQTDYLLRDVLDVHSWHSLSTLWRNKVGELWVHNREQQTKHTDLHKYDQITVGRSRQNKIRIHSSIKGVSSLHLCISVDEYGEIWVEDLGSTNGSWANGRRLSPHQAYRWPANTEIILGQNKSDCRLVYNWTESVFSNKSTTTTHIANE